MHLVASIFESRGSQDQVRNHQAKIDEAEFDVKLDFAQQQLEKLLKKFDQSDGYEIVALHVDQALNALKDFKERKNN